MNKTHGTQPVMAERVYLGPLIETPGTLPGVSGYREERYVCVYGRVVDTSGADRRAEPRCRGQRNLGDANADQKACCAPLACRDPDHQAAERGGDCQRVVEPGMRRERDRPGRAGGLNGEAEKQSPDHERHQRGCRAEAEHERRGHDRRRRDRLDHRVG